MLLINDDNYFEDEHGDGVYDDPKEPKDGDDDDEKRNVWEVNGEVGGEQVIGGGETTSIISNTIHLVFIVFLTQIFLRTSN